MVKLISVIPAIIGTVGFIWMIPGIPLGIIFLIIGLTKKQKDERRKFMKWAKIGFGGLGLFIVALILWAILNFIAAMFGVSLAFPLPAT